MRFRLALLLTLVLAAPAVALDESPAELSMREFLSAPPAVRLAVAGAVRYALQLERVTCPQDLRWRAVLSRTDFFIYQSLGSSTADMPAAWAVARTLADMGCGRPAAPVTDERLPAVTNRPSLPELLLPR